MNKCIKCGSYAFNLHKDNIDQGSLCDVHYWQGSAHRAEAQPEQEPVATKEYSLGYQIGRRHGWNAAMDFTPPQRTWVELTEQERNDMEDFCEMIIGKAAFDAIEAKLRSKNG